MLDASSAAKLGIAVRMLAAAFPADPSDPATWDECDRLLRHGVEVAQLAEARGVEPSARAVVFHAVGRYLHRRDELPAGRTVAVISGGNIAPALLAKLVGA